jgi:molecular chaperone DnaJ
LLTFDGLQTVKIPEGSQAGSRVRLKGLGVPRLNQSGRGDLFVHVDVRVPTKLSREQRKLFEQLRDLLPAENEPEEKGLLDKVKDYFV